MNKNEWVANYNSNMEAIAKLNEGRPAPVKPVPVVEPAPVKPVPVVEPAPKVKKPPVMTRIIEATKIDQVMVAVGGIIASVVMAITGVVCAAMLSIIIAMFSPFFAMLFMIAVTSAVALWAGLHVVAGSIGIFMVVVLREDLY